MADEPCWWVPSFRADPRGALIADRHYNRQAIGSPQLVPPGACVVFRHDDDALWVTSWPLAQYVKHDWPGAWVNSTFRHESDRLASDIIREAIAHTLDVWPDPPALGMVTMIDPRKVRHKRDPGRCYLRAGFHHAGWTKSGLRVLQMDPPDMPAPIPCGPKQLVLSLLTGCVLDYDGPTNQWRNRTTGYVVGCSEQEDEPIVPCDQLPGAR